MMTSGTSPGASPRTLTASVGMRGRSSSASFALSARASADFPVSSLATPSRATDSATSRASTSLPTIAYVFASSTPVTGVCPSACAACSFSSAPRRSPAARSSLPSL